ncbi:MAG: hypothetical protein HN995_13680 [Candidatus Marinimicrobia bacterium]|jgi:hypothetical protein|nr:hypothetical protein [Candidatus Neomarinimicrobiota bacterium]MBT3576149.1 hypothetical protein [Candidatus Neomarinimicrobiota bacterium]MBT3679343.1 hypothetical protein [Candidatus Neomarinimicrobiota bacterium]MBT5235434.1 hypothetical protein [Candidatus Neomarinimicrobiota bacterium]MBT6948225.1 hypothetical protein [Candidatus Neomarinimicrobiota bacterium]
MTKQIKATITRYRRLLNIEWKEHHFISDGAGKRFMIGPLYLRIDDTKGAMAHYKWFEKMFDDDSGEPFHRMGWTLTLQRHGDDPAAERMLLIAMLKNLYLFPQLFGEDLPRIDGWEGSNWENLEYITEAPKWMLNLWSEEELEWAKGIYYSEQAIKIRDRYITINQFLELERPGEKRSELVMEASKLVRGDYSSMPL